MAVRAIDAIDRKILAELQRDGRITVQDLADRVGLSPSPTLRRIRMLEEAGILKGYVAWWIRRGSACQSRSSPR